MPSDDGDGVGNAGGYAPTFGGAIILELFGFSSIPIEQTAALKGISECAPIYPLQSAACSFADEELLTESTL